jgi:CheY-like chemotaxis protein/predicted transcriptional regulator
MQDRKKRGRPPGGDNPGERVVDYPQLSVRVPRATLRKLRAAATVQRRSHAKVLSDAIDRYLDALQPDQKTLVEGLLRRATDVFEQPSKRPHTDRAAKPITVLNVDDHEAALFARTSILRKEGWHVVEAQTGRGALEAVRHHQPDVVLLDVHLPDINGLEVCRQIKSDATTRHIKVVQVSASVRAPLDQLHCLEEGGADMYLTEPMSRGTLLSVIDRLLNGPTAA